MDQPELFLTDNPDAEARAGRSAMTALARFLGAELNRR